MDKSTIKTYAAEARHKLIEAVKLKAQQLYIFEDSGEYIKRGITQNEVHALLRSDGIFLSSEQLQARERLYGELLHEGSPYKPAIYNRVMENVACTWFNRLIALRIMEVNDWLPSNIRILSSREPGRAEPDAMREVERLDYVSQAKVAELRENTDINASEMLYKYLLISQCNVLSAVLPGMFQKENDYTELLLPDALLAKGGIVNELVNRIHEDNFNVDKQGQIEIVGWLYQYYISEKKDEVFEGLKKNIKINKDTIPAATQLFTPEWIVKYMVENSLGRIFVSSQLSVVSFQNETERIAKEKEIADSFGWKYYVPEAEQTPEVRTKLNSDQRSVVSGQNSTENADNCSLATDNWVNKFSVKDIKLIDPCMGSGHILVYAFDVLFQIYQSVGYAEREIPNLILQNNLYGLDIDDRARQLAYFALMIKARSYNRRFFRQENIPQPMVYAVPEIRVVSGQWSVVRSCFGSSMNKNEKGACLEDLKYLVELFSNGKEYGSALKIEREVNFARLREYVRDFASGQLSLDDIDFMAKAENIDLMIEVAEVLSQKYDVVVTNPPYMSASGMSNSLSNYTRKMYPASKADMSTVFMEICLNMCNTCGYSAMINIPVWMSLPTYAELRTILLQNHTISTMVHCGRGIFGSDFGTTAFVIQNNLLHGYKAVYRRLFIDKGAVDTIEEKEKFFFSGENHYEVCQEIFNSIPGNPIVYWEPIRVIELFDNPKIVDLLFPKTGITTGNNEIFLRLWFEVDSEKQSKKWFYMNKGGEYRKWYGNNEYVIDYEHHGKRIKEFDGSTIRNEQYYFKEGVTWSKITAGKFSARYSPPSHMFDAVGLTCFSNGEIENEYFLAFFCSLVADKFVKMLNQTVSYTVGIIGALPFIYKKEKKQDIVDLASANILISRTDWDSYETSWDFQIHPFILYRRSRSGVKEGTVADAISGVLWDNQSYVLKNAYEAWEYNAQLCWENLKSNEEELNRIFIEIYGLQDELTPEVEDKDVTVRRADLARDIRSFVSYAVGCTFGRYSLDEPGLTFAGGKFSDKWSVVSGQYYLRKVLENYGCTEISRLGGLAESDVIGENSLSVNEEVAERRDVLFVGSDETGGCFNTVEYSGRSGTKLHEGACSVPVNSERIESRAANSATAMRRDRIPCRYGYKGSNGTIRGSKQNAGCPHKKTDHCPLTTFHYGVVESNIIPINTADYFDNDIVLRFTEFVRVVYGDGTLNENLNFIADALYPNGSGSAQERIRRYFLNDFYKDHVKIYQKRPIYWLLDSGKKDGFKALFYLHRHDKYTVARARMDYLHPIQRKYEAEIKRLDMLSNSTENAREKAAYRKEIDTLQTRIDECRVYDQVMSHIAHQQIELDLDDGVKVNYEKFQGVVVPKDDGKTETMDLLAKI